MHVTFIHIDCDFDLILINVLIVGTFDTQLLTE